MRQHEIKVGKIYSAKVSGQIVHVRVEAIREVDGWNGGGFRHRRKSTTHYDVTNLRTKRKLTFKSAAKFRPLVFQQVLTDESEMTQEEKDQMAEYDRQQRTADEDLDASEREDQPEEVEKNRSLNDLLNEDA
jgi:hypothetical protein